MDERLYHLLNTAQYRLRGYVDEQALARTGLTSAWMGLLFFVAKNEGCALSAAARALGVKNAAMTGLVARAEKTGSIKRRPSREDARATQLFLTAKGRRKLDDVRRLNEELDRALRAGFTEDEIALVVRFLQHVRDLPDAAT